MSARIENSSTQVRVESISPTEKASSDIDLCNRNLDTLGADTIWKIKDRAKRLALYHNNLSCLPDDMKSFSRLQSLNLKSNCFKSFPTVLCQLPHLESLDISDNTISDLPLEFGCLMNLKALSIARNKLRCLPAYIAHMESLEKLKVFGNPLQGYPSDIVHNRPTNMSDMQSLIKEVKTIVIASPNPRAESERGNIHIKIFSSSNSESRSGTQQRDRLQTDTARLLSRSSPEKGQAALRPRSRSEVSQSFDKASDKLQKSSSMNHYKIEGNLTKVERSQAMFKVPSEPVCSIPEISAESRDSSYIYSRQYFKRLSRAPEEFKSRSSFENIFKLARGLVFSATQIHHAVSQLIIVCTNYTICTALDRLLNSLNARLIYLINILERQESQEAADKVALFQACEKSLSATKELLVKFTASFKQIYTQIDVRYTRTLLLLLFGAFKELQLTWSIMRPLITAKKMKIGGFIFRELDRPPSFTLHADLPRPDAASPSENWRTTAKIKGTNTNQTIVNQSVAANINRPSEISVNTNVDQRKVTVEETDQQLAVKIKEATSNASVLLTILQEMPSQTSNNESSAGMHLRKGHSIRMKDLSAMYNKAIDVTHVLQSRIELWGKQPLTSSEKHQIYEDIQAFIRSVIVVANTLKTISTDITLPRTIQTGLSALTRSTKEVTILFSNSSLWEASKSNFNSKSNSTKDSTSGYNSNKANQPPSSAILTPLSAAVGLTAVQNTLLSPRSTVEHATPTISRAASLSPYSNPTKLRDAREVNRGEISLDKAMKSFYR